MPKDAFIKSTYQYLVTGEEYKLADQRESFAKRRNEEKNVNCENLLFNGFTQKTCSIDSWQESAAEETFFLLLWKRLL